MGETIDWAASEPPNRYVLAFGTNHCLVEQDYDHDVYEECSYIGSRTLIKCKAVRKKSDLRENGGICELHKPFHDSIRSRLGCEDRRLMQDPVQGKPKYNPILNQDGIIRLCGGVLRLCLITQLAKTATRDEYPWLIPSHKWESPLIRSVFDDAPDDDAVAPLRNAGVFTDKDVLRMRKLLLERRMALLKLHAEMMTERAWRQANDLLSKNGKIVNLGESQSAVIAACSSIDDYGVISKRIKSAKKYANGELLRTAPKVCSFGKHAKNNNTSDSDVKEIIDTMLDCVADEKTDFADYTEMKTSRDVQKSAQDENVQPCSSLALPLSKYCISHQMLDEHQFLFVPCSVCHSMCTDIHTPPLCAKHLKDLSRGNRFALKDPRLVNSPAVSVASGVPLSPASKLKTFNDPTKPLFGLPPNSNPTSFLLGAVPDRRLTKRLSVDVHSKEEAELLAKRFKAEVPAELTVAEALKQGQSPAVIDAIKRAELRRTREDEAYTCARARPFERAQFPPKQSLPRRVTNPATRAPVAVRRPAVIEGAPLQQPSSSLAANAGGQMPVRPTPSGEYQKILQIPQRRPQPPHRFVSKDVRPMQYTVVQTNDPNWPASSSPITYTTAIDEAGNEVLIEDRHTPPPPGERTFANSSSVRQPISSYRRQLAVPGHRPQVAVLRGRDVDSQRHHSVLPPPPDPPIIPLSRVPDRTTFGVVRSAGSPVPTTNQGEILTLGGRTGPVIIPTTSVRDAYPPRNPQVETEPSPTVSEQRTSNPPVHPRFPTILRKTDTSTPSSIPVLPPPPPAPIIAKLAPPPRPPPATRPLPPHRLITAPRPVPPHRLIKTLPLPTVPPPRVQKANRESSSSSNTPEPPKEREQIMEAASSSSTTSSLEKTASSSEKISSTISSASSTEKQVVQEKVFVEKDMDPLSILAAVSEAARDGAVQGSAAKSSTPFSQAPVEQSKGSKGDDEDDDFEEEL